MTVNTYFGTAADFIFANYPINGQDAVILAPGTVKTYTAVTGGSQYDMTVNGQTVSSLSVGSDGQIPAADIDSVDPDGEVWVSINDGPRVRAVPQGQRGATGATGPKGDTGLQGPKGDTGSQGPQGLPGVNAVPADNAVASYVSTPGTATQVQLAAAIGSQTDAKTSRVYYVDQALGSDTSSGKSFGKAFKTITKARMALGTNAGRIILLPGIYPISATIQIAPRQEIVGLGRSNVTGGGNTGVILQAQPGFTGDYVLDYPDATAADCWHWGLLDGFAIDCNKANGVSVGGIHIFNWGEEAVIRRVAVYNAAKSGYLLTGTHAVARLEDFSAWDCDDYGIKITASTTTGTNTGSVSMIGSSGDDNAPGWLYHDGSVSIVNFSPKHEKLVQATYAWYTLAGSTTGGSRARLTVTGGRLACSAGGGASNATLVRITGTATPTVIIDNPTAPAIGTIIDDQVNNRQIAASSSQAPGFVLYGADGSENIYIAAKQVELGSQTIVRGNPSTTAPYVRLLPVNPSNVDQTSYATRIQSGFGDEVLSIRVNDGTPKKVWRVNGGTGARTQTFSAYTGTATAVDILGLSEDGVTVGVMNAAALPAASATYRGQLRRIDGGAGVADRLVICRKDATDAYAWVDLY